jgi:hypothetical protein
MSATTPRTIRLTDQDDLDISAGTLIVTSGVEAVRSAVRIRLQAFLGEWFADTTIGTPWFQSILIKNPDPSVLNSVFRDRLFGTPGVTSLNSLDLSYDRVNRTLTVRFSITCDFGVFDDAITL